MCVIQLRFLILSFSNSTTIRFQIKMLKWHLEKIVRQGQPKKFKLIN